MKLDMYFETNSVMRKVIWYVLFRQNIDKGKTKVKKKQRG